MPTNAIATIWPNIAKPIVGMLHLPALPGAPLNQMPLSNICETLLRDAQSLALGGIHGLMMENFGDTPFFPGRVPTHVATQMTAIACEIRRRVHLPLGINVLRNDGQSALAVANGRTSAQEEARRLGVALARAEDGDAWLADLRTGRASTRLRARPRAPSSTGIRNRPPRRSETVL